MDTAYTLIGRKIGKFVFLFLKKKKKKKAVHSTLFVTIIFLAFSSYVWRTLSIDISAVLILISTCQRNGDFKKEEMEKKV